MLLEVEEKDGLVISTYQSTNLMKSWYSAEKKLLVIEFFKGTRHSYHPVDEETHQNLIMSTSVGSFFESRISKNPELTHTRGDLLTEQTL